MYSFIHSLIDCISDLVPEIFFAMLGLAHVLQELVERVQIAREVEYLARCHYHVYVVFVFVARQMMQFRRAASKVPDVMKMKTNANKTLYYWIIIINRLRR